MPHPLYTASVPVFQQFLAALSQVLAKAEAHATARKIDPDALLHARLFPDMWHTARQAQAVCDFAKGTASRLAARGSLPARFRRLSRDRASRPRALEGAAGELAIR